MDIPIIFEDEHLIVVDKPAGIVVDKSETNTQETVADIMQKKHGIKLERGGVVHRLDKDTSGLLLIAKTQTGLEQLQFQFKERMVKKEYLALIHGLMEKPEKIVGAIARNPARRENFIVKEGGKEAETEFVPVKSLQLTVVSLEKIFEGFTKIQLRKLTTPNYQLYTLATCRPLTGRTHQIRVHLKHLGFPIVADSKYGGRKTVRLDHRWCPRQFLHAAKIEFYHPTTGRKLKFESPLPEDLEKALNLLESSH